MYSRPGTQRFALLVDGLPLAFGPPPPRRPSTLRRDPTKPAADPADDAFPLPLQETCALILRHAATALGLRADTDYRLGAIHVHLRSHQHYRAIEALRVARAAALATRLQCAARRKTACKDVAVRRRLAASARRRAADAAAYYAWGVGLLQRVLRGHRVRRLVRAAWPLLMAVVPSVDSHVCVSPYPRPEASYHGLDRLLLDADRPYDDGNERDGDGDGNGGVPEHVNPLARHRHRVALLMARGHRDTVRALVRTPM